jgi:cytochrome c556
MRNRVAVGAVLAALTTFAVAGPIEDQIRFRQSAYAFISWNVGKIKSQVVDQPQTYNKDQVSAAANAIAATANSGLGALFGPGTEQGTGFHPTKVKPEFFTETDKVRKVALDFNKEANELARIASGGDITAIKTQFTKLGETCKGCHSSYRVRD